MCGIGEAVKHVRAGHAAARAGWVRRYIFVDITKMFHLRESFGDFRNAPACLSCDDILATDWVFFRREDADKITATPVVHTP